jgi:hypothetical protein
MRRHGNYQFWTIKLQALLLNISFIYSIINTTLFNKFLSYSVYLPILRKQNFKFNRSKFSLSTQNRNSVIFIEIRKSPNEQVIEIFLLLAIAYWLSFIARRGISNRVKESKRLTKGVNHLNDFLLFLPLAIPKR